jgi:hypothetical protein
MEIKVANVKAVIKSAEFIKEYDTKFGKLYQHRITYNDKSAYYSSKKQQQETYKPGNEYEFVEEERNGQNGVYYVIKPMPRNKNNNYSKAVKKEQSRYSGFAVSYVKDLIIADKIKIEDLEAASKKIFKLMVDLDKTLD